MKITMAITKTKTLAITKTKTLTITLMEKPEVALHLFPVFTIPTQYPGVNIKSVALWGVPI